ncbi:MAG: TonB family protein [Acidimicrobiia bacterium]|nr:TonB family protein [Acidimicrobiia bacterium]
MRETPELRLLLEDHRHLPQPNPRLGVLGTIAFHLLLAVAVAVMAPLGGPAKRRAPQITADLSKATPLVAPPAQMTQKDPGSGKVSTEVNLEGLLSQPSLAQAPPASGMTRPAAPRTFQAPPLPAPTAPEPLVEPPKIEVARAAPAPQIPPGLGNPQATIQPPPEIEPQEKPAIAFERPGASTPGQGTGSTVAGRIPLPTRSQSIEETGRQVLRGGGGGLVVGDLGEGAGGLGSALNNPGGPLRQGSSLELLSDPMGADFRPYLIRILSTVRRNWFAVIPESVRLGRRGKVLIQFAINRDGSVPKLVIASPSGTEALDRAAVAGISASNPFPPLPDEFKGQQVRLQFTFLYNIPSR